MRKYPQKFDKALRSGLRKDRRSARGDQALYTCSGLKPTPNGLCQIDTFTSPYTEGIVGSSISSIYHRKDAIADTERAAVTNWTLGDQWVDDSGNNEADRTPGAGAEILGDDQLIGDDHSMASAGHWVVLNSYTIWTAGAGPGGTGAYRMKPTTGVTGMSIADTNLVAILKNNTPYRIKFRISSVSGSCNLHASIIYGSTEILGSTQNFTGDGTYSAAITTGTISGGSPVVRLTKEAGTLSDECYVDYAEIFEVTGYAPTGPDYLQLANNKLVGTSGVTAGKTYYLNYTIDNYSAGTLTPYLGGTAGTARSADGTYFEAIVAGSDATGLKFLANTDFEGSVDRGDVHLYYLSNGTGSTNSVEWPFPQIFRGREVTLIAWKDQIATVNETTWVNTNLTLYDASNTSNVDTLTGSGAWHFMDFGTTWALFNGLEIVYYDPGTGKYLVWDDTAIKTGCNFRGRAVMAGFSDWPAAWKTAWQKLAEDDSAVSHTMSIDTNWVVWSPVGTGGLGSPWWLGAALASLVTTSGMDAAGFNKLREWMLRNDWGFMPLPFQGDVVRVEPLGKAIACYGTDGCCFLVPGVIGEREDRTFTFGIKSPRELRYTGIAGRSAIAVAGGDGSDENSEHVIIDTKGNLWHISPDLKVERLGYSEYGDALSTIPVGSYLPAQDEDEFYFFDGTNGLCLTRSGLSQTRQGWVSSVILNGSGTTYATVNPGETLTSTVSFTTQETDFGVPGKKTVANVIVLATCLTNPEVAVSYRYKDAGDGSETWTTTGYTPCDSSGWCSINITADEFRIVVRGTPVSGCRVHDLIVEWELHDKCFIRSFMIQEQGMPGER